MASIKMVLRAKKNKEGLQPIAFRIIENRKTSFIFSGTYVKKDHWDEKNLRVKKQHPNYIEINNMLSQKLAEINSKYLELESKGKVVSSRQIKQAVKKPKGITTFNDYAKNYLNNLKSMKKLSQHSADSARVKHFLNFLKNENILFSDINETLLQNFMAYLKSLEKPISDRSVMNNLVVIRTLFNKAIRDGIVDKKYYPFGQGKIMIKFPDSIKVGLTQAEVIAIENLNLEEGTTIYHTRNVWLFSFNLAGIRVSDLLKLQWENIRDNRLIYGMDKNGKAQTLKLSEKATKILEEYRQDRNFDEDYIFPELKTAIPNDEEDIYRKVKTATKKFDKYLKRIAEMAGINKKVTMHISRHTFGNISGDKVSPQMLQKLYRHSHISTTMGYQKNWIHKDADEALDKVLDF